MPNLRISGLHGQPLLDIASYARRGPGRRDLLTPAELELIQRTVRRTPEVMVKVLPKDSNNLRSVARHLNYIGRYGELGLETDEGNYIQGKSTGQQLLRRSSFTRSCCLCPRARLPKGYWRRRATLHERSLRLGIDTHSYYTPTSRILTCT
jgi:hypothetical protein